MNTYTLQNGVLQGTVLSSTLLIVGIDYLIKNISPINKSFFAYDLCIFISCKHIQLGESLFIRSYQPIIFLIHEKLTYIFTIQIYSYSHL